MIPFAQVIGDPIAHSKSPLIHGFWLRKTAIEGRYTSVLVPPEELATYFERAADDAGWRGCNVTLPHKLAVMDLVGDPGDVRGSMGAMNTVLRQPGGVLIGTNTDAAGFIAPIADLPLADKHVVVIGTGGAAHAVLFALAKVGVGFVTLLARSPLKGAALLARFGLRGEVLSLGAPLPLAALLVNASSLGMTGQPPLVLDLSPLPGDAIVYDLVYAPLDTSLLGAADARGLAVVDGIEMLIGQAAIAFELFFGKPAPREHDVELRALLIA